MKIPRKELLYLALMMHDVGKSVRDKDHSIVGAEMTRDFLKRLQLPDDQIETVVFLVRHHLAMSAIAQRRDLSDQRMIAEFASTFSHPDTLRMLYVLTYADLSAVTQTAWTSWKGHLLRELYENTFYLLTKRTLPDREQPELQDIQKNPRCSGIAHPISDPYRTPQQHAPALSRTKQPGRNCTTPATHRHNGILAGRR